MTTYEFEEYGMLKQCVRCRLELLRDNASPADFVCPNCDFRLEMYNTSDAYHCNWTVGKYTVSITSPLTPWEEITFSDCRHPDRGYIPMPANVDLTELTETKLDMIKVFR